MACLPRFQAVVSLVPLERGHVELGEVHSLAETGGGEASGARSYAKTYHGAGGRELPAFSPSPV